MIDLFIIFVIVIVAAFILSINDKKEEAKECKVHTWSNTTTGRLFCTVCYKVPSLETRTNEE